MARGGAAGAVDEEDLSRGRGAELRFKGAEETAAVGVEALHLAVLDLKDVDGADQRGGLADLV